MFQVAMINNNYKLYNTINHKYNLFILRIFMKNLGKSTHNLS